MREDAACNRLPVFFVLSWSCVRLHLNVDTWPRRPPVPLPPPPAPTHSAPSVASKMFPAINLICLILAGGRNLIYCWSSSTPRRGRKEAVSGEHLVPPPILNHPAANKPPWVKDQQAQGLRLSLPRAAVSHSDLSTAAPRVTHSLIKLPSIPSDRVTWPQGVFQCVSYCV